MAALLAAMTVMAILMSAALPAWRTQARREKEAELIFRGEQYARAIGLYQRRFANVAPPSIDVLVDGKFLRKKYKDPITDDDFQIITAGQATPADGQQAQTPTTPNPSAGRGQGPNLQPSGGRQQGPGFTQQPAGRGGIVGVMSKSSERSFRVYNGRDTYNQWVFMGVQQSTRAGGPGGPAGPAGRGGRGVDGRGGADGRGGRGQDGRGAPPQGFGGPGGAQGGRGMQPPPAAGRGTVR
jgi:type II secretory pathway pseudopilin PulG